MRSIPVKRIFRDVISLFQTFAQIQSLLSLRLLPTHNVMIKSILKNPSGSALTRRGADSGPHGNDQKAGDLEETLEGTGE